MAEKHIDLGLTALDELFMTEEGRQENRLPRIRQIPLDMIDDGTNWTLQKVKLWHQTLPCSPLF